MHQYRFRNSHSVERSLESNTSPAPQTFGSPRAQTQRKVRRWLARKSRAWLTSMKGTCFIPTKFVCSPWKGLFYQKWLVQYLTSARFFTWQQKGYRIHQTVVLTWNKKHTPFLYLHMHKNYIYILWINNIILYIYIFKTYIYIIHYNTNIIYI